MLTAYQLELSCASAVQTESGNSLARHTMILNGSTDILEVCKQLQEEKVFLNGEDADFVHAGKSAAPSWFPGWHGATTFVHPYKQAESI